MEQSSKVSNISASSIQDEALQAGRPDGGHNYTKEATQTIPNDPNFDHNPSLALPLRQQIQPGSHIPGKQQQEKVVMPSGPTHDMAVPAGLPLRKLDHDFNNAEGSILSFDQMQALTMSNPLWREFVGNRMGLERRYGELLHAYEEAFTYDPYKPRLVSISD